MLYNNEVIISESNDKSITLTESRIIQRIGSDLSTITLDKVSCIKVQYTSKIVFLAIGIPFILFGLFIMSMGEGVDEGIISTLITVIGIVFVVLFFTSRKHAVSIYSDAGQAIDFITQGMRSEDIVHFVNKIDEAKVNFVKANAS